MPVFCIVCHNPLVHFGPKDAYNYCLCRTCRTLQLSPMPDENELEAAYQQYYATAGQTEEINDPGYWETAGQAYRQDLLQTLLEHGINGPIVDFGAGWGHLCALLIARGFDCKGVEVSEQMAGHARKEGLPVTQGSFEALRCFQPVNAVLMCAVFEHLSNHRAWLLRFNSVLANGGHLITLHPTAACYTLLGNLLRLGMKGRELPELHGSFCPPWHTALFSLQAMEILARQTGFSLIDIRPASQGNVGGPTGLLQQALGAVNRVGYRVLGNRWPLVTAHVFVLKKVAAAGPPGTDRQTAP